MGVIEGRKDIELGWGGGRIFFFSLIKLFISKMYDYALKGIFIRRRFKIKIW